MGWGDKFNQLTKTAVSKSKEVAEITRLNMEISSSEQKMKELAAQIGMIVAGQSLLSDHEEIAGLAEQVRALQEAVARNQSLIQEIRNINICAQCGAEVSRTSKFCDKCGSPMDRSALESADAAPVCPACGEPLEPDALFCTNCGAKVSP
ncbi:MAG: zinc-ribbon domain-containing protein [Oscillibacter sp.]|nr:zinc-ribbon domain-containing protein [Oscillibacter sp.]